MKAADKPRQGQEGATPTPIHCGEYMTRQSVRVGPGRSCKPASWICRICGEIQKDEEAFKKIKKDP